MTDVTTAPAPPVRVIVDDEPGSGLWNMAVDEVLLESALTDGRTTLRWYRWDEATLSLGHFQAVNDPLIDECFAALPHVRRLSGGGAILHDRELTYSCAIGPAHRLSSRPSDLYAEMHAAIVRVLSEFGIDIHPRGLTDRGSDAHFLCFSRGDMNDLVMGGHKVLGSAQRRRRGAVLQHGALLLERSPVAPDFPGVFDLADQHPTPEELLSRLVPATADVLGSHRLTAELTVDERRRVNELTGAHK